MMRAEPNLLPGASVTAQGGSGLPTLAEAGRQGFPTERIGFTRQDDT